MFSRSGGINAWTNPAMTSNVNGNGNQTDFSMLPAELLGGAPLPPLTPAERQQYITGITIKAKFIGAVEVPEPRGEQTAITAINRVRAAHKANKESKQRMWLVMSTAGIKILDFEYRTLRDSYALNQIAYVTTLPSNRQVFGFITANNTVRPPVFKCHVFKSKSRSVLIAQTMGRCFSLALEMARQQQQQQQQPQHIPPQIYAQQGGGSIYSGGSNRVPPTYAHPYATPYGPASTSGRTYSTAQSSMGYGSAPPSASQPGASSFKGIVERIRARCEAFLPQEDQYAVEGDLDKLCRLYEMAQDKLADAERRASTARASSIRR